MSGIEILTYGDRPGEFSGHSHAADQQIRLEAQLPDSRLLIGDADTLSGHAHGGADNLVAFGFFSQVVGDARLVTDHATGGDDEVWAGGLTGAFAFGDAFTLDSHGAGGNDSVTASAGFGSLAVGFGDAGTISDHARGGDDTLTGFSEHGATHLYGDASMMTGFAQGGDDALGSTDSVDYLYGDADLMDGRARGGADTLTGQDQHALNHLYGDARILQGGAIGGDDLLVAGSAPDAAGPAAWNWLYGDGEALLDEARGGSDTLIGGAHNADVMWGDAITVEVSAATGADTFVLNPEGGHDEIMDFEPGKDTMELNGFGFGSFQDISGHLQAVSDGVLITLGAEDDVLLRGVSLATLTSRDFLLG